MFVRISYHILYNCLHAQIEYFLRKLTEAMGGSWVEERFEDYKLQLNSKQQSLNAWELIILVGSGHFSKGMDRQTLSMGINEVYQELILDVLKQVGSTPAQTDDTVSIKHRSLSSIPFCSRADTPLKILWFHTEVNKSRLHFTVRCQTLWLFTQRFTH